MAHLALDFIMPPLDAAASGVMLWQQAAVSPPPLGWPGHRSPSLPAWVTVRTHVSRHGPGRHRRSLTTGIGELNGAAPGRDPGDGKRDSSGWTFRVPAGGLDQLRVLDAREGWSASRTSAACARCRWTFGAGGWLYLLRASSYRPRHAPHAW